MHPLELAIPAGMAGNGSLRYIVGMTMRQLKTLLERVETWPEEDQDELAELARDIEARRSGVYKATPEELQAIDEALGQIARGEIASKEEVEAAFASFRIVSYEG